jgi:hypothetical protein
MAVATGPCCQIVQSMTLMPFNGASMIFPYTTERARSISDYDDLIQHFCTRLAQGLLHPRHDRLANRHF